METKQYHWWNKSNSILNTLLLGASPDHHWKGSYLPTIGEIQEISPCCLDWCRQQQTHQHMESPWNHNQLLPELLIPIENRICKSQLHASATIKTRWLKEPDQGRYLSQHITLISFKKVRLCWFLHFKYICFRRILHTSIDLNPQVNRRYWELTVLESKPLYSYKPVDV